jgi:protein-disulfide isomerase
MRRAQRSIVARMLLIAAVLSLAAAASAQTAESEASVAAIDDLVVRESDLDSWWQAHEAASYARVRQDWYDGRRKALDAVLGDYLLQREAASRGMSVERLLAAELPKRATPVTDDEIRQMYERSLPLPGGMSFDQVKPMATTYLQQQHLDDARARFVGELRESAHVTIRLEPPRQPVAIADVDPARGFASAPIQLVEFSDFECPYCKQLEPVLTRLRDKYGDRLRLVWKDFPLPIHSQARGAAEAARCAGDQGHFWEYHDLLFANQQSLAPDDLKRHAATMKLDLGQFAACLEQGRHRAEVTADLEEGTRQGIEATPTVFINGRAVIGAQPFDVYEELIQEELSR